MERNEFYDYVYCGRHRLDSGNHHFSIAQQLSNYFRLDYLVLHKFLVRLLRNTMLSCSIYKYCGAGFQPAVSLGMDGLRAPLLVSKSDALILSETGMTSLAFAPEHSA